LHPLVFVLALCGFSVLLSGKGTADAGRPFAWAYLVAAALFFAGRAKMYYLFPAYPIILSAGSVYCERKALEVRRGLQRACLALLIASGAAMLPYTVPVLPLSAFLQLDERLSIQRHIRFEKGRDRTAPIIYGDMLGWPKLAAGVAQAYSDLPTGPPVVMLAGNYGIAAALEHFGAPLGLPQPVCAHNDYYLWGPGLRQWEVVLAVGVQEDLLATIFADVLEVRRVRLPFARESVIRMHLCRSPRRSLPEAWRLLKMFR
jgi:hypothetical protein